MWDIHAIIMITTFAKHAQMHWWICSLRYVVLHTPGYTVQYAEIGRMLMHTCWWNLMMHSENISCARHGVSRLGIRPKGIHEQLMRTYDTTHVCAWSWARPWLGESTWRCCSHDHASASLGPSRRDLHAVFRCLDVIQFRFCVVHGVSQVSWEPFGFLSSHACSSTWFSLWANTDVLVCILLCIQGICFESPPPPAYSITTAGVRPIWTSEQRQKSAMHQLMRETIM
jgi:hypothetical protein